MSDFTGWVTKAEAMVAAKGATVTFRRESSTFTATTGRFSGSPTTATGNAVRVRGVQARFPAVDLAKLANPLVLLVAASSLSTYVPTPGDAVTFASVTAKVEAVDRVAPNGTAILFYVLAAA